MWYNPKLLKPKLNTKAFIPIAKAGQNTNKELASIPGIKKYVIANIKKPIKKGEEIFFKYQLDFICECQV